MHCRVNSGPSFVSLVQRHSIDCDKNIGASGMQIFLVGLVVDDDGLDERATDVPVLHYFGWEIGPDVSSYRRRWMNVIVDSY